MAFAPSTAAHGLRAHDPTYLWKIILRSLSILLSLISIIIFAWAMAYNPDLPEGHSSYSSYITIGLCWSFITLGISILWSCANIIVVLVRKGRYIHPVANVVVDLLLWLALIWTNLLAFAIGGELVLRAQRTDASLSLANRKGSAIVWGSVLAGVVLLFHLALFISACRYTHARRHGRDSATELLQREKFGNENGSVERAEHVGLNDESGSRYYGIERDASPQPGYIGRQSAVSGRSEEAPFRVQDV